MASRVCATKKQLWSTISRPLHRWGGRFPALPRAAPSVLHASDQVSPFLRVRAVLQALTAGLLGFASVSLIFMGDTAWKSGVYNIVVA
jgi:hypothetical protein